MQYSFSQTFGKGVSLLYVSPTPSFKNSSKVNSESKSQNKSISKSQSGSKEIEEPNDRSPVLESYPSKQINATPTCFEKRLFIERLSKQKYNNKKNQESFRQRQLNLQKQINHVDGINERMKNLLSQLRRQHSHDVKKFSIQKEIKTPQAKNNIAYNDHNKENITKIDRCQSSTTIKKNNLSNWFVTQKGKDLKENLIDKRLHRGTYIENRGNNNAKIQSYLIEEDRIKYKNRLQNKVIDKKQRSGTKLRKYVYEIEECKKQKSSKKYQEQQSAYMNVSNHEGFNIENMNIANTSLKGKIYTSEMYANYRNKQVEKKSKTTGSCQINYKQIPIHTQNKAQASNRQGLLKNKVKTIESEIDTNGMQIQYDQSQNQIQQVSYVQEEDHQQQKQRYNQSIYMAFYEKDKKKVPQKSKEIVCCNCGHNKIIPHNAYEYGSFNTKQGSTQNTDRSAGFQNKLKRISEKIQNYQKKVSGLNIGLASFDSKNINQSQRNSERKKTEETILNKKLQVKSSKKLIEKSQKWENQQNLKDYQAQSGHSRTKTPTWAYDMAKQKNKKQESYEQIQKKFQFNVVRKQSIPHKIKHEFELAEQLLTTTRKENQIQENQNNTLSLKERMGLKMGISQLGQKFTKQIQLDEQFRKAKKQLAKLPEEFPRNSNDKWFYLEKTLAAQLKLVKNVFLQSKIESSSMKQIFQLTDEEADPFYSIAIEDLRQYEETINQCVQCYILSQTYFYENLYQNFTKQQIREVLVESQRNCGQKNIKLDQLTVIISNATKINHKCRDIYLIFKRVLLHFGIIKHNENDKSLLQQCVSMNQLIKFFSHEKSKPEASIKNKNILQEDQGSIKSRKTQLSHRRQKINKF